MTHLPEGTTLQGGKFKIIRFISSGGFGCTYEALQTQLGTHVAIKEFFPKDFCNRDDSTAHVTIGTVSKKTLVKKLHDKFIDEARAISQLHHAGIVKVFDVFEENGTAYYVMEYINGQPLSNLIGKEGLSQERAVKYISQVAEALRYVHSKNRLHLDIKPANIMINEQDQAVLIDFGTSKQYEEEGGENTSTILGRTPGFAPLEQLGNDIVTFSPAADVYALGATLFKAVTGQTPPAANLLASGNAYLRIPPALEPNIREAVSQAMVINKNQRLQTVDGFLDILKGKQLTEETEIDRPGKTDEATEIDLPPMPPAGIQQMPPMPPQGPQQPVSPMPPLHPLGPSGPLPPEGSDKVEKKKHEGTIALLGILGLVAIGLLIYFLIPRGNHYNYDDSSDNSGDLYDSVAYVEEAVEEPAVEEPATENYGLRSCIYDGYVDGQYPITCYFDISDDGSISGRYCYDSTVRNYGNGPASYFYVNGDIDYDDDFVLYVTKYGESELFERITGSFNYDKSYFSGTIHGRDGQEFSFTGSIR